MPNNLLDTVKLEMGNVRSKRKDRRGWTKDSSSGKGARKSADLQKEHDFAEEIRQRWAEDEELKILRHTIDNDPELFILNNLMMSVQFFENYDDEIASIKQTLVSSRESELNARLPPQKHTLIPDVLQQHVAKKVDFTLLLPTLKHTVELLQPIRIYVAFDNIEITEESFASPYSSVNETITYSMQLKPSPSHKGYVLLQRLEVNPPKKASSVNDLDLEEIYSDGDSIFGTKSNRSGVSSTRLEKNLRDLNDDESLYEDRRSASQGHLFDQSNDVRSPMKNEFSNRRGGSHNLFRQYSRKKNQRWTNASPAGSTSSGYRSGNYMDSDSDYSYAQTNYNTPKTSIDACSTTSNSEIPRHCFKRIEYTPDGKIYDARKEKKFKLNSKEQLIKQAFKSRNYDVWYLNSTKFMRHFCRLFTDQLAEPMGFDPNIGDNVQGSVIYRDKVQVLEGTMSTKVEQFEIVPCVCSEWPECAQEWLNRPRATWPHYNIIQKIKEFGCHMIPEGVISDRPTDKYQDLEWQLVFPAAERFLETCLTYPQVKVYLIALMLHKTFIRPVDSIFGLTVSHIKNRLFWLAEQDDRSSKWMPNRTGDSLMKLLNSLYRSISQDEPSLPDYFMRDKNLFQEKSYLLRTQKQLKRIIENPIMYVFHAMENIRHSQRFFPRLDYEELFRILTGDLLILVNPALASEVSTSYTQSNGGYSDYDQVPRFWDHAKQKDTQKVYTKKRVTNSSMIHPRKAYDQVVEIPIRCVSRFDVEPQRLSCLLDFFIRHFIKMAECCHNYRALPEKISYVDQAERLSVLLSENSSYQNEAKRYLEKLYMLRNRIASSKSQSDPPETPKRNPDRPVFTTTLKNRYQWPENQARLSEASETSRADESNDYNTGSTGSSVYTLQPLPGPRSNLLVTNVTIHEAAIENGDNVEIYHSGNSITSDQEATTPEKSPHVVSLNENQKESFLTETTHV